MNSNPIINQNLEPLPCHFFKLACNSIEGAKRRNVSKFVLREFFNYMLDYPKIPFEDLSKYFYITIKEFNTLLFIFQNQKAMESNHTLTNIKRDYMATIDILGQHEIYHILLNRCLYGILEKFKKDKYSRINSENIKMYKETVEALYKYSNDIVKKHYHAFKS